MIILLGEAAFRDSPLNADRSIPATFASPRPTGNLPDLSHLVRRSLVSSGRNATPHAFLSKVSESALTLTGGPNSPSPPTLVPHHQGPTSHTVNLHEAGGGAMLGLP